MYIKINEDRKQVASYSVKAGKNTQGTIEVDCFSPSEYHVLKINYTNYSGVEQWESKETEIKRQEALAETVFDKLALSEAFEALGHDTAFANLLLSDAKLNMFWGASGNTVDLAHAQTQRAIGLLGLTATQIDALKLQIAGIE